MRVRQYWDCLLVFGQVIAIVYDREGPSRLSSGHLQPGIALPLCVGAGSVELYW